MKIDKITSSLIAISLIILVVTVDSRPRPVGLMRSGNALDKEFRDDYSGKFTGAGDVSGNLRKPFSTILDSPQMFTIRNLIITQMRLRSLRRNMRHQLPIYSESGDTYGWFYGGRL